MKNRTIVILYALLLVIAVTSARAGTLHQRRITCILKNVNGTWSILNNEYHDNWGCKSVSQTSTYIRVNYDRYQTIIGGYSEEDGSFLHSNIMAGNSVGLTHTTISFYKNGTLTNPRTVTNPSANIFFEVVGNDL
jgi:hypothetical protein